MIDLSTPHRLFEHNRRIIANWTVGISPLLRLWFDADQTWVYVVSYQQPLWRLEFISRLKNGCINQYALITTCLRWWDRAQWTISLCLWKMDEKQEWAGRAHSATSMSNLSRRPTDNPLYSLNHYVSATWFLDFEERSRWTSRTFSRLFEPSGNLSDISYL